MSKLEQIKELEKLLDEKKERETFNRIDYFKPYPWQSKLLASSKDNAQTLLMAANQVGKTLTGANNTSYHATGLYPDDWEGHKWEHPILCWAAGVSSESTKDLLQNELLGLPGDESMQGSGAIPRHCIGVTTRKPQVPNAFQSVLIKHHTNGVFDGFSQIVFKAFEQGVGKFMGAKVHEIWLDEQPPDKLFSQCATRTANTGGHVTMTFTPEDGMTRVISQFTKDRQKGQELVYATWDDAPHLDEERKKQLLSIYPANERDMRTKGVPVYGSGPVWATTEDKFTVAPFEIPEYWPMIAAIDFGWDHPTAVVWLRHDTEADILYVVDEYRQTRTVVPIHASAIRARPQCPVAWPHDGFVHEKGSGTPIADLYRSEGVQMLPFNFTNPMAVGEKGSGNFKIEPGILAIDQRLQSGGLKVFKTCTQWLEEYRIYHREEGKIHALEDDLMSATRYAHQSIRFAEVPDSFASGYGRGFDKKLNYPDLHLV